MTRRQLSVALTVPSAALVGHALAYLAVGQSGAGHAVDHGYLPVAAVLAWPLALAALVRSALSPDRSLGQVSVRHLVAAQWALFLTQELVEHVLAGHGLGGALHSPALWVGLVAQVAVALGALLVLRIATIAGQRLYRLFAPTPRQTASPLWWLPSAWGAPRPGRLTPATSRGPPLLVC